LLSTTRAKLRLAARFIFFNQHTAYDISKLRLLDQPFDQLRLSKKERATLLKIICVKTMSHMGGHHDEEHKRIYYKNKSKD
ncbi:molecular chaperone DnaJ, partial [Pseudomonas syringae pv. tagetis]